MFFTKGKVSFLRSFRRPRWASFLKRRCLPFLLFVIVVLSSPGRQLQVKSVSLGLIAGTNINMVTDDLYLRMQNEPSIAVSTNNPLFLLGGANDYRTFAMAEDPMSQITGDAWLGVFRSFDGGESWHDELLLGAHANDPSPLAGFDAAADPTVRAGIDGWFYYSGIAFDRVENGNSVVFVARFKDNGSDIQYVDTKIIDSGTSGQFSDKPWNVADIPRPSYPNGINYVIYSMFMGAGDQNIHSKILISRSTDGGNTWEKPVKVSESEQKNQGTTVAIDPNNGTVYIAWRRFADSNSPDGILIAKSENFGQTFTKAVEVASILRPFDQSTIGGPSAFDPAQFRTGAYPTMAIDHNGRVYLAWSQRDVDTTSGYEDDARIVITSQAKSAWGAIWPIPQAAESPVTIPNPGFDPPVEMPIHSHQFMPSLAYGAGKLLLAWYDNRYSARVFNEYGVHRDFDDDQNDPACLPGEPSTPQDPADRIIDGADGCPYRETIDVRTAAAVPGSSPSFVPSTQVSRYIWVLAATGDPNMPYVPIQAQFNPPNYKLFSGGTAPFHGDYLDIAAAPAFLKDGDSWRYSGDGDPFVYYVSWTDNRDVLPLDGNIWTEYLPPSPDCQGSNSAGTRDQNIYISKITTGVEADILGSFEGDGKRIFVITVRNETGSPFEDPNLEPQHKTFQLHIVGSAGSASFLPDSDQQTITVDVPDHSSISRMVFISTSNYPVEIAITEVGTGDFAESIFLSPITSPILTGGASVAPYNPYDLVNWLNPPNYDPSNPGKTLVNPNILAPNILAPNILAPNILAPNILAPNILAPNILAPNILAPNILAPNILAPNILAPNILAASILNPNILAPNILATPIGDGTEVVEKIWTVKNNTNAVISYTFKSIAGDSLPTGTVYTQLLIYKVHLTPSTDGCALKYEANHEPLVNIINPNIIEHIDINNIKKIIGDPNLEFENATFSLDAGEEALVVLRIIDSPQFAGPSKSFGVAQSSEEPSPAESYAGNLGAVVVLHTSTEDYPQNALTLQILPTSLHNGQAGQAYADETIRAIGGSDLYSWSMVSGGLPQGLSYSLYDDPNDDPNFGIMFVISGVPKEAGKFSFTLRVTSAGETDDQTFTLTVADPAELVVTLNPSSPPAATKGLPYSGLTLTAGGGVPFSSGSQLYNWTVLNAPPGLTLNLASSAPGVEVMELSGTPQVAGNFAVTVEVMDDFITYSGGPVRPVQVMFNICVRPGEPFDLIPLQAGNPIGCQPDQANSSNPPICPLPTGELGADYSQHQVILAIQNSGPGTGLTWEISGGGLPPGLVFNPALNTGPASSEIQGTPMYDGSPDYPKTYTFGVRVTETYDFGGGCSGSRSAEKAFTVTINPKGAAKVWTETGFEGAATAVAADGSGGIYVAGYTASSSQGKNFFTRRYLADGSTGWLTFYNGPGNGDDIPSAIAVDSTGVYVTGTSEGGNTTGPDVYTVKYGLSNGQVIWQKRFDGPSHLGDGGNAIAIDSRYAWVAGYVHRGIQIKHADYLAVKYDKMTGNEVWAETYDSRRNGNDIATAIAADTTGNVYVTGKSQESLNNVATSHDFFTIKYDSSGNLQWEARDDGPGFGNDQPTDILVDEPGNAVYVTGLTNGGTPGADYYTVKYDTASGNPLWGNLGRIYNGPGNGDDIPISLAVDSTGNVYVTGKSWAGGASGYDFATVKYDSSGNAVWNPSGGGAVRLDGQVGNDEAVAVANDGSGIYVLGFITGAGGADYLVIRYSAAGDITWIARYPMPADAVPQIATAGVQDGSGIYLTGYAIVGGVNRVVTVKFSK